MDNEAIKRLGPLGALAGIWEGEKGDDTAPSDDRGTEKNKFRERITFQIMDPVQNHEQTL
ncbi:MAG: FABP family protein, partial [Spirochaetia bacterium]|nr:FABP family protein [Spirochaetia bacterium]